MQYLDLFEDWPNTEAFDPRAVIFSESEAADALYVILDGEVEFTFHGEPLGTEKRGGIVGAMSVITEGPRTVTATAVTPVVAARVSRSEFRNLTDRSSDFAFHAMATLANRLRAVDGFISRQFES